ncbi:MAG TPA: DUF3828 domain-containing protein [Pyrinomonadaceae bacterium]|jgi:hypothetical protein|nr:DUF3828 domain-containing protein [Pyrinomonadaceae bacterium]
MKNKLLISICAAILGLTPLPVTAQSGSPARVVKNFYTWYIGETDLERDAFTQDRRTLKKYVTARFIKKIERDEKHGDSLDILMPTREWSSGFVRSMKISKVVVGGHAATAHVAFGDYPQVDLTLVKESGVWKINGVRNTSPPPYH